MAKLDYSQKQIEALNMVMDALEKIRTIQAVQNGNGSYVIGRAETDRKRGLIAIDNPSFEKKVEKELLVQQKNLAKKIKATITKFNIILSDDERELVFGLEENSEMQIEAEIIQENQTEEVLPEQ